MVPIAPTQLQQPLFASKRPQLRLSRPGGHQQGSRSLGSRHHRQGLTRSNRRLGSAAPANNVAGSVTSAPATMPPLPATYRRLVAKHVGKSFREVAVIQEEPLPQPGPGQVLVRLHWAGINGGCETFRARGEYAFCGNLPLTNFPLGAEGAGIVAAVGPDVTTVKVGQPVAANSCSAYAEYGLTSARMVTPVEAAGPEAVALVLSAFTACAALEGTAKIRPGERVLVTAAVGGTGHFAVQLAALAGCHVIAVCGGPEKAAMAKELGAHCAIDYKSQHYPSGVDVIYEGVGGALRQQLLPHLAVGGRLLQVDHRITEVLSNRCLLLDMQLAVQVGYISQYPHNAAATSESGSSAHPSAHPEACTEKTPSTSPVLETCPAEAPAGSGAAATGAQTLQLERNGTDDPAAGAGITTAELFWGGHDIQEGQRRILGRIWPKDLAVLASCKRKVFKLHKEGKLRAIIDRSHVFHGLEQVPDAIEHMLRGSHIGKVVIAL